jgi:potassium efflux system protein
MIEMINTWSSPVIRTTAKIVFLLWIVVQLTSYGHAQGKPSAEEGDLKIPYTFLVENLHDSIKTETLSLNEIKRRYERIKKDNARLSTILNSYRIQLSSHNNLLFLPQTGLNALEKAASLQEQSLDVIKGMIEDTANDLKVISALQAQTTRQLELYENNKSDISASELAETDSHKAIAYLKQLVDLANDKQRILSDSSTILNHQASALEKIRKDFVEQSKFFADKIRERRTVERFERKAYTLDSDIWVAFISELQSIQSRINRVFKKDLWQGIFAHLWRTGGILLIAAAWLYIIFMVALFRLRSLCSRLSDPSYTLEFPWRSTVVRLFCGSILLIGTIVFLFIYTTLRDIVENALLVNKTLHLLSIFLFTNWALNLIKTRLDAPSPKFPAALMHRFRAFILAMRYFAVTYVVLDWMLQSDAITLVLFRFVLELFIIAWTVVSIKSWERSRTEKHPAHVSTATPLQRLGISGIYCLVAFPVVMEFIGYGSLATYWLISWGRSLVVLLWAVLFLNVLREWDQKFYSHNHDNTGRPAQPIKWIVFRVCWLIWGLATILLLILAWGGQQTVFTEMGYVLRYHVDIGDFQISLLGLVKMLLILFFTHMVVRLWRYVLQEKFLGESGLETGIKESIISISVYVLWSIGIIASLSAFGVSGTSLTVAFGALSIGLGFGLQNIFNNFISGIIMLFERPIQVGDSVEINGIWGEVRNINFRSTVVQTFDNASLIIPNSDFISNQVTNWSFKDQSLRIKIIVGVEYGTNIELVRDLLLEIANQTPHVRKKPKPDVLFDDFGDSALVFILRVWTDIDGMLTTGSNIRFAIDRSFKENGIVIPFPQRDLHLRSTCDAIKIEVEKNQDLSVKKPTL